jgi:lipopolysaccharide/colanic/teichoic acid biosynthesis glycosyltransferase
VSRSARALRLPTGRRLIRPGITGWAQVRCGYTDSDLGSAWKLRHDLSYMEHRTFRVDVTILLKTAVGCLLREAPVIEPPTTMWFAAPVPASSAVT